MSAVDDDVEAAVCYSLANISFILTISPCHCSCPITLASLHYPVLYMPFSLIQLRRSCRNERRIFAFLAVIICSSLTVTCLAFIRYGCLARSCEPTPVALLDGLLVTFNDYPSGSLDILTRFHHCDAPCSSTLLVPPAHWRHRVPSIDSYSVTIPFALT